MDKEKGTPLMILIKCKDYKNVKSLIENNTDFQYIQ